MTEGFIRCVNLSICASWLVLVVLLFRLLFKKAPKWSRVLLWGLVGVRLVCPFTIESVLSLVPSAETISYDMMMATEPALDTGISAVDQLVNPMIIASYSPNPANSANPLQILFSVLSVVWIVGIGLLILYSVVSYGWLKYRIRTAIRLRDNIYQSEFISVPFVLGIIRPKIYLPFLMHESLQESVIIHEQAHICRKDYWWKPLGFLILAVYWFNPLLWIAYLMFCQDIELACDEKAIRGMNAVQRADYSQALLSCTVHPHVVSPCPLAFGEVGIKQRVRAVLHYKQPAFWMVITALVICGVVGIAFLTSRPADAALSPDGTEWLNKSNGQECIAEILETLTLHQDNTVSFSVPEHIPVSKDGKTRLTISLSATYSGEVTTVQNILGAESGWKGGENYRSTLESAEGELINVWLRVAFYTDTWSGTVVEYLSGYNELTPPFVYDTPAGYTEPSVVVNQEGREASVLYTMRDGYITQLSFTLPEGVTRTEYENAEPYQLFLLKDDEIIGGISLHKFGTTASEELAYVDTGADKLPMQIFSEVALSNHAGYEDYQVRKYSDTGATATAKYFWQDLSQMDKYGSAAAIPSQQVNCILTYDWDVMPYFVEMIFTEEAVSETEVASLAGDIQLTAAG